MSERVVGKQELEGFVGQNIAQICGLGFTNEAHHTNHCAHFVSHLLGLRFGATCAANGFSIRVNDVYNRCSNRGPWANLPTPQIYSLIFATQNTNMAHGGNMMDGPNKHMGIWSDPYVYNYSTMNHQVLRELVPDFLTRLENVYNSNGQSPVLLFYGNELPV